MKRMLASAWQENSAKMMRIMTVAHAADEVAQLTDAVCSSGVAAPAGACARASAGPRRVAARATGPARPSGNSAHA